MATFHIWSPKDWQDRKPTSQATWTTTCDFTARQEYRCEMIVTILQNGRHVQIKPL